MWCTTRRAALALALLGLAPGRARAEDPTDEARVDRASDRRTEDLRLDHPEPRRGDRAVDHDLGLSASRRRVERGAEAEHADETRGWRSAARHLILPHGVSEAMLTELVATVRSDPAFGEAEAVVLYGSRTHHQVGYAPVADSDLDVTTFARRDTPILEQLTTYEAINRALAPIGTRAGFKVAQELPQGHSFDGALGERGLFPRSSLAHERDRWHEVAGRAEREHWDRDQLKRYVVDQRDGAAFAKEALILVREGPGARHQIARLRRRGYANIAVAAW